MANECGYSNSKNYLQHLDAADYCDHVTKEDLSKAVGYIYERDSFGYVFMEIVCEECRAKRQEQADDAMVCCHDCKKEHPRKVTTAWKWYDFYAPQGDEPYEICEDCWKEPKHQTRLANDKANYDAEFGTTDDEDFDDDVDDEEDDGDMEEPFHDDGDADGVRDPNY